MRTFSDDHAKDMNNPEYAYEFGRNERESEIIKLLEERRKEVKHSLDKIGAEAQQYWQIQVRLLEIDNLIALIKGEQK